MSSLRRSGCQIGIANFPFFCSLEETRAWEASEKEEERKLVADFYLDKLGDLLDRVKDL